MTILLSVSIINAAGMVALGLVFGGVLGYAFRGKENKAINAAGTILRASAEKAAEDTRAAINRKL